MAGQHQLQGRRSQTYPEARETPDGYGASCVPDHDAGAQHRNASVIQRTYLRSLIQEDVQKARSILPQKQPRLTKADAGDEFADRRIGRGLNRQGPPGLSRSKKKTEMSVQRSRGDVEGGQGRTSNRGLCEESGRQRKRILPAGSL